MTIKTWDRERDTGRQIEQLIHPATGEDQKAETITSLKMFCTTRETILNPHTTHTQQQRQRVLNPKPRNCLEPKHSPIRNNNGNAVYVSPFPPSSEMSTMSNGRRRLKYCTGRDVSYLQSRRNRYPRIPAPRKWKRCYHPWSINIMLWNIGQFGDDKRRVSKFRCKCKCNCWMLPPTVGMTGYYGRDFF